MKASEITLEEDDTIFVCGGPYYDKDDKWRRNTPYPDVMEALGKDIVLAFETVLEHMLSGRVVGSYGPFSPYRWFYRLYDSPTTPI